MTDWIVSDTLLYLKPFNFVDLYLIKLEIHLFVHSILYLQNMFTNHIFNIYIYIKENLALNGWYVIKPNMSLEYKKM